MTIGLPNQSKMVINHLLVVTYVFFLTVSVYSRTQAYRVFDVNGIETILALENEKINIKCKADMPMAYCGFVDPTGKRYSFSGDALIAGHCYVNINATTEDVGEWRCHIGGESAGLEIIKKIQLRVVNHLAAIQQNVSAVHKKTVTLSCVSTEGLTPLSYCRFEPPNGKPFSINSNVRANNPIIDRYFFPNNKSLDRGDCAVTIRKVRYEDVGVWKCGAGFDDGNEHIDVIRLDVEGLYTMSRASVTGITFGVVSIAVALILLGVVSWKKRRLLGTSPAGTEHELQEIPQISPPVTPQRTPVSERSPVSERTPMAKRTPVAERTSLAQRTPLAERTPLAQRTPLAERRVPLITVQSPSQASSSPAP